MDASATLSRRVPFFFIIMQYGECNANMNVMHDSRCNQKQTKHRRIKTEKGTIIPWWVVSHLALLVKVLKLDIW